MPNKGDRNTYKTVMPNQNPYNKYKLSNIREDFVRFDRGEFSNFEDLTRKIVQVPKLEVDEKRRK